MHILHEYSYYLQLFFLKKRKFSISFDIRSKINRNQLNYSIQISFGSISILLILHKHDTNCSVNCDSDEPRIRTDILAWKLSPLQASTRERWTKNVKTFLIYVRMRASAYEL